MISDEELESMGFTRFAPWSKPNGAWTIPKDRLKAGVKGAQYAVSELESDLKNFPDETSPSKINLIKSIQNLKTFLGEKK